jgi:DNA transformation protein
MSTTGKAARKQALVDHLVAQMAGFGLVQARAMFGGHGLYHQGLMFALVADGRLFFKVDEQTVGGFERRGLGPFTYESRGKVGSLKYHEAPPEVMDEPDQMTPWARQAYGSALRAQVAASEKRQRRREGGTRADSGPTPKPRGKGLLAQLGPASQAMLTKAGIRSEAALRRLGAVQAYARTKAACPQASLNLLWALEGALSGRSWREVAETDRASLLMALEDLQRLQADDSGGASAG